MHVNGIFYQSPCYPHIVHNLPLGFATCAHEWIFFCRNAIKSSVSYPSLHWFQAHFVPQHTGLLGVDNAVCTCHIDSTLVVVLTAKG